MVSDNVVYKLVQSTVEGKYNSSSKTTVVAAAAADTLVALEEFRIMSQHKNSLAVNAVRPSSIMCNSKLRREEGIREEASYIHEYTSTLH